MSKEIRITTEYGTLMVKAYGAGRGVVELMASSTAGYGVPMTPEQVDIMLLSHPMKTARAVQGIMKLWGTNNVPTPHIRPQRQHSVRRRPGLMDGIVDFTAPGVGDFDGDTCSWIGDLQSLWGED